MYEAVQIPPTSIDAAQGFLGFWSARKDRFQRENFPFSLNRSFMMDMRNELPRFIFSGEEVVKDNNRNHTGRTIDAFDGTMNTTRLLKDHMDACHQTRQPMAWRVTAAPCGIPYSFNKLYLPYRDRLLTVSWVIRDNPMTTLSPRQHEIAMLIRDGHSNKVIATKLGIADTTLAVHIGEIRRRLGVDAPSANRGDLVRSLIEHTR